MGLSLRQLRPAPVGVPDAVSIDAPELNANWHAATQRRRQQVLVAVALLASLAIAALVLWFQVLSVIGLVIWLAIIAIAIRPYVGLCVAFGLVLLFEGGGADQMMLPGFYLMGGLGTTLGIGVPVSPLELLLILTFASWLAQGVMRHGFQFRGGSLGKPMLAFLAALVFGLGRGVLLGGDANIALWESRFLFYCVMCYMVAANTIRTRAQVRQIVWIMLITTLLWSIEGAYRRIALIDSGRLGVIPEFAYSHESVIFLGTQMLLVMGQWVFGAPFWQKMLGLLSLPIVIFTLLATERRAGYIAIIIGFIVFTLVFLMTHRKAFFFVCVPLIVGFLIYLPIFWNNTSPIGQPARAVRSLSQPDPRDAQSNLYRELEKIDIIYTIKANPIFGVGFGRPFDFVVYLPDLSWWPFWHYEPHHNILWVWLKLGTGGFIIFWTLLGAGIARATQVTRTLKDNRDARVFALFALSGIVTTAVFCYVDLGLTSGRVTVFLGTLMGTLSVLHLLNKPSIPEPQEARHAPFRRHLYP
jgi:hypothetical protein